MPPDTGPPVARTRSRPRWKPATPWTTTVTASWTIVCLRAGHATAVATSYEQLAQQLPGCDGPSVPATAPGACLAASKRFCQNNNHYSGFGPVANGLGLGTTVICVDL